jgi:flagellar hook protein FlgE
VVTGAAQDGYPSGARMGVVIDAFGVVKEQFDNGQFVTRYRIPVINYINPPGLEARSGNVWAQSETSGGPTITGANDGIGGVLEQQTLESSTVDLSEEFSSMIVTQRAYSANTKTLTTADEMYKTVVQMKG